MEELKNCRVCGGSNLKDFLELGAIYPSTFLKPDEKISEEKKVPLTLTECLNCGLMQLKYTVELDEMYRQYWYSSSLNKSMVSSLQDVVNDIESRIGIKNDDIVVDIGANDGTLLSLYRNRLTWTVAFEPALNIKPKKDSCLVWIPDYFSKEAFHTYIRQPLRPEWSENKAKVITAIAMFYDLPDPNKFVADVKSILHEDGIFVVQFTDLLSMMKACAFDNICHEHLEYYKLSDVLGILESNGLSPIDVSYNDVNGGSVRITACHLGRYRVNNSVYNSLLEEGQYLSRQGYHKFLNCIYETKEKLLNFLWSAKHEGKTVIVLGASTKGNTLLQVCGITPTLISFAAEVNKEKWGLRTVGSDIYIIPEQDALKMKPDYLLVLPWHFKENLLQRDNIKKYMEDGGKLIFPLPEFEVVGKE